MPFVEALDRALIEACNSLVGLWPALDTLLLGVIGLDLLKMGIPVALLAALWTRTNGDAQGRRRWILASLVACCLEMGIVRGLTHLLPFRSRPLFDASLDLRMADGLVLGNIQQTSSMPSDHAGLCMALAAAIWVVSRPLGLVAFAHAFLFICMPRVVLGLHWPTDILAGGLLGPAILLGLAVTIVDRRPVHALTRWTQAHPAAFAAAAILFLYQMTTLFGDVRSIALLSRNALAAG